MRNLCVFDLDGTLISHDSFGRIVRGKLAHHPTLALAGLARNCGLLSRANFARLAHGRLISGLESAALQAIAAEVAADVIAARRAVIEDWRAKSAHLVLMSASPHEYVARVGALLGFDAAHGSHFEGARYVHLHGRAKLAFLEQNYPSNVWTRAFAMADSDSDLELLAVFDQSELV